LLMHMGRAGYTAVVDRCLKLTWKLAEEIQRTDGVDVVTEPTLNVVGVKSDRIDVHLIFQELRKRGWAVSLFSDYLRIVIMPHTKPSHIKRLLEDLQMIIENLN
jgi:tyrosine decarboxylase/aspartate 1-decarboxylase